MLINTFLDTEDFVHLYYTDDEPSAAQGCGAGARMASKLSQRPPSPDFSQVSAPSTSDMSERERYRAPPQPEPPPHRVRAADLYPRLRTHYDDSSLDIPFTPICGESVQWVGRMADGGTIAMSNYRLHTQPKRRGGNGVSMPLRIIDVVEIRDLLHLVVLCKHGQTLKCTFSTGDQCLEWWRRLNTSLTPISAVEETFAAAYAAWAKEQSPASVHRALVKASHPPRQNWFGPEVERLAFTAKGAWRISLANSEYKLCPSYPPMLVVPASIGDEDLDSVARFRAMRRIPAVVWRHRGNGAVLARSSQPEVGWLGWRSSEDERLLTAFVTACDSDRGLHPDPSNKQHKLLIIDARSYASAVTNRARGGGCECQQYYPSADIQFMCLPNIHHVRKSFQQLRALAAEPSDQANWHSNLERTLWPWYISGLLRAASVVARALTSGRPVLVHCSDGWDRTPQIVTTAELMLDPYYRTLEGFRVLIEREWLEYGHKFADRCGHQFGPEEANERSPVFLQWLDVVHQMMLQYPCSFEFNEAYLIKMATHVHSCMFGTFLCNNGKERSECRVLETTTQVWQLLRAPPYRNHLYTPRHPDQVLWVECSVRSIQFWGGMFSARAPRDDDAETPLPQPTHNGLMTKTRSCDNLLNEGEKKTAQRRCSDPNLAPDVMKLSMVVNSEGDAKRSTLTDSCVDELCTLTATYNSHDQVVNLHPDHFESPQPIPRDLASDSSSLERELAPPVVNAASVNGSEPTDAASDDVVIDHLAGPVQNGVDIPDGAPTEDTSEDREVFLCDTFGDIVSLQEVARETGRTRNISITWRSISESSNQSSSTGFDLPDTVQKLGDSLPPTTENSEQNSRENSIENSVENSRENSKENSVENSRENSRENSVENSRGNSHESSPLDNHNSTEGDLANHNVSLVSELTNHNRQNGVANGVNGIDDLTSKLLEAEINGVGTSSSSESEGECRGAGSQLTLCPASPRTRRCCHCRKPDNNTSGIETSGDSGSGTSCTCGARGSRVCVCGRAGSSMGRGAAPDPVDGLPPARDPLQDRLHQIIMNQQKVVEELTRQLRDARAALQRSPTVPPPSAPPHTPTNNVGSRSGSGSGSGSGSASEVEIAEEARLAPWLPDSMAPRCQHCTNHFWLARRRHHCRRCGGVFCGSCCSLSDWGSWGAVRVCRRCRQR